MNLVAIRKQITKLQAEITAVENAIPPFDQTEGKLRTYLEDATRYRQSVVDSLTESFRSGRTTTYLLDLPTSALIKAALGIALAGVGIEHLLSEARTQAEANDTGGLKLAESEKSERLAALRRELYLAEAAEEQALEGQPRRDGIKYAAAILGIPVDVAEAAGLLK